MGRIIMVTGGIRSGKSVFAEQLLHSFGTSVLYIATAVAADEDMQYRITRHRELRPEEWDTLEAFRDIDIRLEDVGSGYDAVMLDCVSVMVDNLLPGSNEMDWEGASVEAVIQIERAVRAQIKKVVQAAKTIPPPVVFVTNEMGLSAEPASRRARVLRDVACRVNTHLASAADEAYLLVSGIPVKLK